MSQSKDSESVIVKNEAGVIDEDNPLSVELPGFKLPDYDYIAATYPNSTTEVYTYKSGGSSGTTVGTVTVTYSNSSKETLTSVEKT